MNAMAVERQGRIAEQQRCCRLDEMAMFGSRSVGPRRRWRLRRTSRLRFAVDDVLAFGDGHRPGSRRNLMFDRYEDETTAASGLFGNVSDT
jgi:hypothetical protein